MIADTIICLQAGRPRRDRRQQIPINLLHHRGSSTDRSATGPYLFSKMIKIKITIGNFNRTFQP
jgi:hypothetical protein